MMNILLRYARRIRDSVAAAVLVGTLLLLAVNLALAFGLALVLGWSFGD